MSRRVGLSSLGVLLVLAGAAGSSFIGVAPVSAAAGDPTFETPTGNPGTKGSVGLYNASGVEIYSGTVSDDPIAAYFVTSGGAIKAGDHIATAYTYTPQDNVPADQWTTPTQLTGGDESGTAADSASYPGALHNTTKFVAVGFPAGSGASINDSTAAFPLRSTNDPGILQIRVTTAADTSHYYSTDIKITGSTWTQVYPAAPVATAKTTSTTLAATPNPSTVGQAVGLSATETASDGTHPAGSVQFKDGATALGSAVTVDATGKATASTATLAQGSHSITAVFTPTATGYSASTSAAVTQVVNAVPAATTTKTALSVSPTSPVVTGTASTLTATITPAAAVGTVQFLDGTTAIGTAQPVNGGTAQLTSTLALGNHSLTAKFTPTDATSYTASTSTATGYLVNPVPAATTSTALTIDPAGPVTVGDQVILTGTVSPAAAPGTIQFFDGSTALGAPIPSSTDGAMLVTSTLAAGTHSLTAKFAPTNAGDYGSSVSAVGTLVVKAAPVVSTATTLSVTPAGPVDFGSAVLLSAGVTPATAAGSVEFRDGSTVLATVAVSDGTAEFTTSALAGGSHALTAVFLPTRPTAFAGSTSPVSTLVVSPRPTTTVLTVAPAGPVSAGTAVQLHAVTSPAAAGTVQFLDAGTVIGSAPVKAGSATLSTTDLAVGDHVLSAVFTPTSTVGYQPSTSADVALSVKAAATIGSVSQGGNAVTSGATLAPGAVLNVSAVGFVPNETVRVLVDGTVLQTVTADADGAVTASVTLPTTLGAGKHVLTLQGQADRPGFAFAVEAASTAPTSTAPTSTAPISTAPTVAPTASASPVAPSTTAGTTAAGVPAAPTTPAAAGGGSALASTGSAVLPAGLVALLVLAAGIGLTTAGRHRRSH